MKKNFAFFCLLFISIVGNAQINVTTINKSIVCCGNPPITNVGDSIYFNETGKEEIYFFMANTNIAEGFFIVN